MKTVSKNIRQLRQKMGWRQREVAELLKISIPAYSKIETAVTDLNTNRLRQIVELFKVFIFDMISSDVTGGFYFVAIYVRLAHSKLAVLS